MWCVHYTKQSCDFCRRLVFPQLFTTVGFLFSSLYISCSSEVRCHRLSPSVGRPGSVIVFQPTNVYSLGIVGRNCSDNRVSLIVTKGSLLTRVVERLAAPLILVVLSCGGRRHPLYHKYPPEIRFFRLVIVCFVSPFLFTGFLVKRCIRFFIYLVFS